MPAVSHYLGQSIVNWLRGTPMPAAPSSLAVGLFTGNPLDDGSGVPEIGGGVGYARSPLVLSPSDPVSGVGVKTDNSAPLVFGPCVNSDWGPISHWAVFSNAGNQLLQGPFAEIKTVHVGMNFVINEQSLALTADVAFSLWLGQHVTEWLRGTNMPSPPTGLELALYTSSPGDSNTGSEVIGASGYARIPVTLSAPLSVTGFGTSTANNSGNQELGPAVNSDWGSVSHWALFSAAGDFLLHGSFLTAKPISIGDYYLVNNGAVIVRF